jgi:fatty acid desaturase
MELDHRARELVRDLHSPRPAVFWTDLLVTALISWTAFGFAVALRPGSWAMLGALALAALGLYRGLCFVHEISHIKRGGVPGFEGAWNALFGFPMLLPSFVYSGVHQDHHKLSTYGTAEDPEYMPFARSSVMTAVFAAESFFIPIALAIRFLVLAPLSFVWPPFELWLAARGSSLVINVGYRRAVTGELRYKIRRDSLLMLVLWGGAIALAANGLLPWRVFAIWFAAVSLVSFINTLRTLGAHEYESDGSVRDREGQLRDSINTPGAFWTELWAPVGLRYHALHHYFPGIPYHNLSKAHRRLAATLPVEAPYQKTASPSLGHSLIRLYRKGLGRA